MVHSPNSPLLGHAAPIALTIQTAAQTSSPHAEDLAAEATYFQRNTRRMNYLEMREQEWLWGAA